MKNEHGNSGELINTLVKVKLFMCKIGNKIRFLRELSDGPTEDHPACLFANKNDTGEITEVGGCREGYWVKTDWWDAPFGCERKDFTII